MLESLNEEETNDEDKTTEADENQKDEAGKKDADKADEGAPEKYEEFKAPEGVALDAEVVKVYSEVAKELNLSQDKAQSVIDKLTPILAQRQAQQYQEAKKKWAERTCQTRKLEAKTGKRLVPQLILPYVNFAMKKVNSKTQILLSWPPQQATTRA